MSFPIFTSHVVPLMNDREEQVFAERAELELFNEVVIGSLKYLMREFRPVLARISGAADKAHAVADLIVAFFRAPLAPLLRPPVVFTHSEMDITLPESPGPGEPVRGFELREKAKELVYQPWIAKINEHEVSPPDPASLFWTWVLAKRLPDEVAGLAKKMLKSKAVITHIYAPPLLFGARDHRAEKDDVKEALSELHKKLFVELRLLGHIRHQEFWRAFLATPQDTRPGPNASKLIPHLLATSAIACSIWLSRTGQSKSEGQLELELAILRLACLLHDIGKPESWLTMTASGPKVGHPRKSADETKKILSEAGLPDDLIDIVCSIIESHHAPQRIRGQEVRKVCGITINLSELLNVLIEADKASSAMDRLADASAPAVANVLQDDANKVKEMLKTVGKEAWSYWLSKDPEQIREASEEAAKELLRKSEKLNMPFGSDAVENVCVAVLDIMGIQGFIYRERLPIVVGASYAIDLATMYVTPRAFLEELNLPPECLIYAGGGVVYAIIPRSHAEGLSKVRSRVKELVSPMRINVVPAWAPLYKSWPKSVSELYAKLEAVKRERDKLKPALPYFDVFGFEVLCEICHRRPATKYRRGERVYVCDECNILWDEFGHKLHFGVKVEWLRELLRKLGLDSGVIPAWERLRKWILEWLSGMKRLAERAKNLAVLKADGNMMGFFMATAVSLSDAILRSARVDHSMKLAIFEAMRSLWRLANRGEDNREELLADMARLFIGLLYAGGDDMMALWPARAATQATATICYWFWRGLGGVRQLSVGLASGKPKHNIWALIQTSEKLLSSCKNKLRKALTVRNQTLSEIFRCIAGLMAMIYADTHVPLPCWVPEQTTKALMGSGKVRDLTWQPFAFLASDKLHAAEHLGLPNAWRLYGLLADIGDAEESKSMLLRDIVDEVFKAFYSLREATKDLRNLVRRAHATNVRLVGGIGGMLTFLVNQALTASNASVRRACYGLAKMVVDVGLKAYPPLLDAFNLAKFVIGE